MGQSELSGNIRTEEEEDKHILERGFLRDSGYGIWKYEIFYKSAYKEYPGVCRPQLGTFSIYENNKEIIFVKDQVEALRDKMSEFLERYATVEANQDNG